MQTLYLKKSQKFIHRFQLNKETNSFNIKSKYAKIRKLTKTKDT